MNKALLVICMIGLSYIESGCSIMAPQYSASIENVQKLKDGGNIAAKVGKFDSSTDQTNANPISLRGMSLLSPYENSYAVYLVEAIKQELALAGKMNLGTDIEISGVLLKNDIDASGFSTATGNIEARFVVKKGEAILYSQVKTIHSEWESSLAGMVAIPRAQQEYPQLVQRLLAALYDDQAFLRALKSSQKAASQTMSTQTNEEKLKELKLLGFKFEVQRLTRRIPDWVSGIQVVFWDGCSIASLPCLSPVV